MSGFVYRGLRGVAVAAALAIGATGAQAATISTGSLGAGAITLDLAGATPCGASGAFASNVGVFARGSGPDGSGTAACGNRDTPQVKSPTTPHPYGRFDPNGGSWVDSNDVEEMIWTVDIGKPVRAVSFALSDAHDQPDSHFRIDAGGASWSIDTREPNGTLHLVKVRFDMPEANPQIAFHTRLNDGYGLAEVSVAPIPAPPAALLLLSGLGIAALVRRRARRSA